MREKGFTLAEVLITLTIIGVIAAMTMPSLNSNMQNRTIETALSKNYSILQEAISRFMVDESIDNIEYVYLNEVEFGDKYLKSELKCTDAEECFADSYTKLNNTESYSLENHITPEHVSYVLKDGSVVAIPNGYGTIIFDVNGTKGPNKINRDLWILDLRANGTIQDCKKAYSKTELKTYYESCLNGNTYGCFGHFVTNGFKFDY